MLINIIIRRIYWKSCTLWKILKNRQHYPKYHITSPSWGSDEKFSWRSSAHLISKLFLFTQITLDGQTISCPPTEFGKSCCNFFHWKWPPVPHLETFWKFAEYGLASLPLFPYVFDHFVTSASPSTSTLLTRARGSSISSTSSTSTLISVSSITNFHWPVVDIVWSNKGSQKTSFVEQSNKLKQY